MLNTETSVIFNFRLADCSFLGCNHHDTIGTTGTVDSSSRGILQEIEWLNIVLIDGCGYGGVFHRETVNDIKRRVVLCQRVVTTDDDVHLSARHTFARAYIDTGNTSAQCLTKRSSRSAKKFCHAGFGNRTRQVSLAYFLIADYYHFVQCLCVFL